MRGRCFSSCLREHKSVSWRWTRTWKNKTVISSCKITLSIWFFSAMSSIIYQFLLQACDGEDCCLPLCSGRQKESRLRGEAAPEIPLSSWSVTCPGPCRRAVAKVGLSAWSCSGSTHQRAPGDKLFERWFSCPSCQWKFSVKELVWIIDVQRLPIVMRADGNAVYIEHLRISFCC